MRRVISLWLPTFATDRLSRKERKWRVRPFVTALATHGGLRVAAVNPRAQAAGIVPNLPLADARALVPNLEVSAAEPTADMHALTALAEWCGSYTPWTAPEAIGTGAEGAGVWLDATGCSHLFGGEEALLESLVARVEALGFAARAAIADTPGAAWAVVRFGGGGTAQVVAPDGAPAALAELPVAALRLAVAVAEGLAGLGLRRVGDLIGIPRAPLVARFGESLAKRLDQALGHIGEPISPLLPPPVRHERLALAEPVGHLDDVRRGLDRLLARLCRRLEHDHAGVRRLDFTLFRADGSVARARIGTSRPARDPGHLAHLFAERLEDMELGEGIEVMTLSAASVEPLMPSQLGLERIMPPPAEAAELAPLVDRLANRLGADAVTRLAFQESHVPERAARAVPATSSFVQPETPGTAPAGQGERPLRLFPRPLPIDAVAPVPDGPPVLFRWRRVVHRIARAEGPERIAPEWWRTRLPWNTLWEETTRDYYRVEDEDGRRFWLYREGLYSGRELDPTDAGLPPPVGGAAGPRWFVHGLFA